MDKADRQRLKQLANDSIIATFGRDDNEARLAVALERCIDKLEQSAKCPVCGDGEVPDWSSLATTLEGLGFRLEPL